MQLYEADQMNIPPYNGAHYFVIMMGLHAPTDQLRTLGPDGGIIMPNTLDPAIISHPHCWHCDQPYHPDIANQCPGPQ